MSLGDFFILLPFVSIVVVLFTNGIAGFFAILGYIVLYIGLAFLLEWFVKPHK